MNHGFTSMIRKQKNRVKSGSAVVCLAEKSAQESFKNQDQPPPPRSGPSRICSTGANSVCGILCGSVVTSAWTCVTCTTWIVGSKELDPTSQQCTLALSAYCARVFCQKWHDYHRSPFLFARFSPLLLFLFPKVKTIMWGERFGDVENIKREMTRLLKNLTSQDMQHCFLQWKKRWAKCIHSGEEYFEGDHVPIPE
jgi:hypothetical protein